MCTPTHIYTDLATYVMCTHDAYVCKHTDTDHTTQHTRTHTSTHPPSALQNTIQHNTEHAHIHTHTNTCAHTHTCKHTHTPMQTHTHTHTHTHVHKLTALWCIIPYGPKGCLHLLKTASSLNWTTTYHSPVDRILLTGDVHLLLKATSVLSLCFIEPLKHLWQFKLSTEPFKHLYIV